MTKAQLNIFHTLQSILTVTIDEVSVELRAGISEKDVETILKDKLQYAGVSKFWYPVMVSVGENTSKLFSRRIHLPDDTRIRENDIVIVDATPLDASETVWGNWCQSYSIKADDFYSRLCDDVSSITISLENYAIQEANTIGEIYSYFTEIIQDSNLELVGDNIGHSIFPVKVGQTVEQTVLSERLFIDKTHSSTPLKGVLSIEPQLKRRNTTDRNFYAAKQQRIIIFNE